MRKRKKFDLLLRERDISVKQLAKELDVSGQAVYRWIWGTGTPDPETMLKLTKILNVSAEEILQIFTEQEKEIEKCEID